MFFLRGREGSSTVIFARALQGALSLAMPMAAGQPGIDDSMMLSQIASSPAFLFVFLMLKYTVVTAGVEYPLVRNLAVG